MDTIPNLSESIRQPSSAEHYELREVGPLLETPSTIINIYMRPIHVMQSRLALQQSAQADIVLRPMNDSVWYDFYHPVRYIRRGVSVITRLQGWTAMSVIPYQCQPEIDRDYVGYCSNFRS